MADKIFGVYNKGAEAAEAAGNKLVVEIGNDHVACLLAGDGGVVHSVEWFKYNFAANDHTAQLQDIINESMVAGGRFTNSSVFLNTGQNVWAPLWLFNEARLDEVVTAVHGPGIECVHQYDALKANDGMVNMYRVPATLVQAVKDQFGVTQVSHSQSTLLEKALLTRHMPAGFIQLFVYDATFVLLVFKMGSLQLVRSFDYQTTDDVLYHLLNACQLLQVPPAEAIVKVSGFIDEGSAFYNQLADCFVHLAIETAGTAQAPLQTAEHPLHYFTPVFKLVS